MFDRYWDNLDLDNKWKKLLDAFESENVKSINTRSYRKRSLSRMSEELVYLLKSDIEEIDDIFSESEIRDKKSEKIAKLRYAVKCLTDKQQQAIDLYFFQRKKQREISGIMACSQQNVSDLISRSLTQITKKLMK